MKDPQELICVDCGKKFYIQKLGMENRHFRSNENICQECYRKISKGGKYLRDNKIYPKKIRHLFSNDILEYTDIKEYLPKLKTKKRVRFICQECGCEDIMSINRMRRRKICGIKPICRKCSLIFATNSDQWRDANSKSQYIAQNRPEVIEKQRQSQLKLMANDPLYAEKRCSKFYISGTIRGFRFDSSWELYFLAYCWESDDILNIKRYEGSIEYFDLNKKKRAYYPDFVVEYKNGSKKVIEIKGSKKYNNFHEKFNAARKKHGINYLVYEERDLISIGINFRRESFLKKFYSKYYNEIVFFKNTKTETFEKRIKEWLK